MKGKAPAGVQLCLRQESREKGRKKEAGRERER